MANVILPGGETVWVEPVGHRTARGTFSDHVVYRGDDVIPNGKPCGNDHGEHDDHEDISAPRGAGCQSTICVTELACDADFEYFQDWGSVTAVENRINNVINSVNNQYESQCNITHVITTIIVRTSEPDPYTATNSDTLLGQFRSEWLNNQGGVVRDVAKLFTGKEIDGSVIGQAWTIGGICTTSAYCQSQSDCCGSFACTTDLCAHELGHLWGAFHCSCPSNTMNPSITCTNNFTSGSVNSISAHRDSRTCLDPLESGNTTLPFSDTFPSTTINSSLWIGVDGATVDSVGNGEPSAPNSLRINGSDAIRSAYINASAADNVTLSYWWQRTGGGNSPEAGEDLFVEYFDIFGNWTLVAQHPGNGGDTDPYQFESFVLPNSAEHQNLRIRFRGVSANAGLDDFFVDDVSITADLAFPGAFSLLSPTNGATEIEQGPFFDWTDSANASSYRLRVDDDPGFGSPIIDVGLAGSAANIGGNPLATNTVYFWTVDAINVNGSTTSTPASFTFTTEGGTPTGPQARLERGAFAIDNGGTHDHGETNQGVPLERAYRVYNDGTSTLNLSNLSVPAGYTITKNVPNNVLPGVSKTFKVQLDAVSQGSFVGTISFNTNDADDNPFAFTVTGTVVQPPQPPMVRLTRGAFTINNGDTHNHGTTTVNVARERAYKVWNDGDEQLQLSNLIVPNGYTITKALPPSVNGGASKVYKVALLSATPGFFSGTMSFNTNDPDDNPFAFTVQGTVNSAFATGGPITPTADGPLSAAAADFTGDGHPDVILTHANDEVSLFAGNGQGGMVPYDSLHIRNGASGVASGD
ncbi:MAG: choice-of-anchor D domain-containing protein, partial [Phycisphaerales bacterium]|nr:choice-of-anchor D domain-containing protein [Phycisphaerales bacterium]